MFLACAVEAVEAGEGVPVDTSAFGACGARGGDLLGEGRVLVAFKSVLIEGLEAAFIVVTLGGSQNTLGLVVTAATAALVVVVVAGALAHRPLSRVPENTLKYAVGLMLTAFGMFWRARVPARLGLVRMGRSQP